VNWSFNSTFQIIYNVYGFNGQHAWHPHYYSKCLLIPQFVKTNKKKHIYSYTLMFLMLSEPVNKTG